MIVRLRRRVERGGAGLRRDVVFWEVAGVAVRAAGVALAGMGLVDGLTLAWMARAAGEEALPVYTVQWARAFDLWWQMLLMVFGAVFVLRCAWLSGGRGILDRFWRGRRAWTGWIPARWAVSLLFRSSARSP
jgi:hypothetical protein